MSKLNNCPSVTIIMPIRNEADFIARSLGSVLAQDYPHECMEVIIADGVSDDNTRHIVEQLVQSTDISITILDNPKKIVPTGFNKALRQANGEIIVRVDGHCEIAADYISRCVSHLQQNEVQGVGGPIETIGATPLSQIIATAMSSPFGVGGSAFRTINDQQLLVDTVAFPAYRRDIMHIAGELDEEMVRNQDDEYNYRLRKLGFKILLAPDIRSTYYSRSSLARLWSQYYQYGYWKVRVMQKHPKQMRPRQFVPVLFVVGVIIGAVLAPFSRVAYFFWILFLITYVLASGIASLLTARGFGWQYFTHLPLIFAILHISYGVGFLHGLVDFRDRWGK